MVHGLSPVLGSVLTAQRLEPGLDSQKWVNIKQTNKQTKNLYFLLSWGTDKRVYLKRCDQMSSCLAVSFVMFLGLCYLEFLIMVHLTSLLNWLLFLKFIYLREREGGAERETEDPKQALCWQQRAWCGTRTQELGDHELSQSQMLNWLSHPGGLNCSF